MHRHRFDEVRSVPEFVPRSSEVIKRDLDEFRASLEMKRAVRREKANTVVAVVFAAIVIALLCWAPW